MYNKQYYEDKQKDIIEQLNKLVDKKVQSDYEFVTEHANLVKKHQDIEATIVENSEEKKSTDSKPADKETESTKKEE